MADLVWLVHRVVMMAVHCGHAQMHRFNHYPTTKYLGLPKPSFLQVIYHILGGKNLPFWGFLGPMVTIDIDHVITHSLHQSIPESISRRFRGIVCHTAEAARMHESTVAI